VCHVVEEADRVPTKQHVLTGVGAGMMLMHRRVETGNVAEHDNEAEQNGEAESTQPNRTI
jgi:hypothetical protein